MHPHELFCNRLWHSLEQMEEHIESTTHSATPCWIFDKCLDDSAGEVTNAITQEMEYRTVGEDGFEIPVSRTLLNSSPRSLDHDLGWYGDELQAEDGDFRAEQGELGGVLRAEYAELQAEDSVL